MSANGSWWKRHAHHIPVAAEPDRHRVTQLLALDGFPLLDGIHDAEQGVDDAARNAALPERARAPEPRAHRRASTAQGVAGRASSQAPLADQPTVCPAGQSPCRCTGPLADPRLSRTPCLLRMATGEIQEASTRVASRYAWTASC